MPTYTWAQINLALQKFLGQRQILDVRSKLAMISPTPLFTWAELDSCLAWNALLKIHVLAELKSNKRGN
jgi:hypothetical protein